MINWGELDGRVDPSYYKKEYRELESLVLKQGCYKLRDFIKTMAGGATPKTTESEKYYSDDGKGFPFLRVQNLSPDGLKLDNCKLINYATHNNMLARSKVFSGDLLTKITGVGRMAVSSIAPIGFEGNINQHLVVIKTENEQTSRLLANFLNSDVGEKLASRRSTGGTRPALDYTALRSIPIILSEESIAIMDDAYAEKQQKEKEAQELLDSINSYLLGELGIAMPPEEENTLESRKFYASSADVLGGRFDPNYYNRQDVFNEAINQSKYDVISFKKLITDLSNGVEIREYSDSGFRYLRVTDMGKEGINNNSPRYVNVKDIPKKIKLSSNDLLISRSGSLGFVNVVEDSVINSILSSHIFRVSISLKCNPVYLQEYLRSYLGQFQFFKKNNGAIIPEINQEALKSILIVLPNQNKQREITDKIEIIRSKAKQLKQEADDAVKSAKAQVEKILLDGSL